MFISHVAVSGYVTQRHHLLSLLKGFYIHCDFPMSDLFTCLTGHPVSVLVYNKGKRFLIPLLSTSFRPQQNVYVYHSLPCLKKYYFIIRNNSMCHFLLLLSLLCFKDYISCKMICPNQLYNLEASPEKRKGSPSYCHNLMSSKIFLFVICRQPTFKDLSLQVSQEANRKEIILVRKLAIRCHHVESPFLKN